MDSSWRQKLYPGAHCDEAEKDCKNENNKHQIENQKRNGEINKGGKSQRNFRSKSANANPKNTGDLQQNVLVSYRLLQGRRNRNFALMSRRTKGGS
jgi:hypothetical protein